MKKANILLVDDIEANLISLEYLLKDHFQNIEIITAESGEEALKIAFGNSVDLIILDIQMPGMDGFETATFLKKNQKTKEIPIIFLTAALKEEEFQKRGFEIGAVDYLTKPINNHHLLNKLKLYIEIFTKNSKLKELNSELTKIIKNEKILHRENKKQKKLLQTILDTEQNLVVITDFKEISFANNAFLEFFCIESLKNFQERYSCLLDLFLYEEYLPLETYSKEKNHIERGKKLFDDINNANDNNRVVFMLDCHNEKKSFYLNISKTEEEDELYLLSFTDITKMQENYMSVAKQAYFDGLTGVYNRRKFNEFLLHEMQRVLRTKQKFSCIILDIDNFKRFNDTYGHLIGDEILISIATEINAHIRSTDKFARWGGEEFVLLLIDTSIQEAKSITEKLRRLVESIVHKTAGGVSASFGVSEYRDGDTAESLFKRCDDALYRAKENGRNRVELDY